MSAALPQDDELSALLSDLDDVEEAVNTPLLVGKPIKQPKKKPILEETKPEEPIDVPEHTMDPEPPASNGDIDLSNLYSNSLNELLVNYRKDRQDIDKLITFIWEKLSTEQPRVLFETLAISLRTKSEANANLVKLLDNISKKLDKPASIDGLDLEGLLDD